MAEIVTLELPETLAQRAKEIAVLTNRRLVENALAQGCLARVDVGR